MGRKHTHTHTCTCIGPPKRASITSLQVRQRGHGLYSLYSCTVSLFASLLFSTYSPDSLGRHLLNRKKKTCGATTEITYFNEYYFQFSFQVQNAFGGDPLQTTANCIIFTWCVLSSHFFWTSDLWTHQPGSHRGKGTQEFFLHLPSVVRALIFITRRIQPSLFPRRS